ncbi:MAG: hypothetical protein QGD94_00320 [Planctomycetia bacterium]|nr:hypothetical protein [Planctomycetia bacterium]
MELEFKPDFADACAMWEAFWKGENRRPLISAVVPKPGVEPVVKPPYAAGADGNFEPVIDQLLTWAATHEFLFEAVPFFYLEFAADHFATLLGADLTFSAGQQGGWPVHIIDDFEEAQIKFRPDGKWWQRTAAFARALRKRCDGKLLIASNTLTANLDALMALRGAQGLLWDMVERPEAVHALEQVTRAHGEILDALAELLDYNTCGSINRHGMYCRGRINVPQADMSCMISPAMFADFVLPYLRREMANLDAVEYHLDGPDALKHLEALCLIEELDIIQWVPGAGEAETQDWTGLYEKIDALGKGQILGGKPEQFRRLLRKLKSPKLFFGLDVASRDEAERFVEELQNTAH